MAAAQPSNANVELLDHQRMHDLHSVFAEALELSRYCAVGAYNHPRPCARRVL